MDILSGVNRVRLGPEGPGKKATYSPFPSYILIPLIIPVPPLLHPGRCCTVNPVITIFLFDSSTTTRFFHLNSDSPTCFGELDFRNVVVGLRVYLFVIVLSSTLMGQYSELNNRSHLFLGATSRNFLILRCLYSYEGGDLVEAVQSRCRDNRSKD